MPTLDVVNFNIVCATLGGFISLFGLVSYLLKERFYLSEPLISLLAGITFSPHALGWIKPLEYAQNVPENIDDITLYFSRLVLGVQLVLAGIQLPPRYLKREWRSLALLLGPGMTIMWLVSSLLVWAMVPHLSFLHALAVGACVTPTDPVLSNSIVKGKFADKNIPSSLQKIIIAESGANDGLGYPFLFLALYLIKYNGHDGFQGAGEAMRLWFGETWGYTILLSVVYGAVVGWVAKELLYICEKRKYVDRESFLVFAITLALFIVGTCGMIGSDDVLACFIAGNAFTWDDWFRLETEDDSLQPTIDMLLNIAVFAWYGAVCPWPSFRTNDYIPIYRLIFLGVLILLLRRLPMMMGFYPFLPQVQDRTQAFYTGFFGPIGVSAVFYLYISVQFLESVQLDGEVRPDCARLADIIRVVVWFLGISSIVVHGMSVPLGKFGYHFPRQISQAISDADSDEPEMPQVIQVLKNLATRPGTKRKQQDQANNNNDNNIKVPPPPFKLGPPAPIRRASRASRASRGSRAQAEDVEAQSRLEPSRPVIIIDDPLVQPSGAGRPQSSESETPSAIPMHDLDQAHRQGMEETK